MYGLGRVDVEIPEHVGVSGVCGGMALVGAVEGWKLDRVSDEEDGEVVEYKVLVSLCRFEFQGPAVHVADRVGRTGFRTDGGNAREDFCLLADAVEKVGVCDVGDVVRDLEVASCSDGFGVYDAFRDSFSREVGECFKELGVLEKNEAPALAVEDLNCCVIAR